MDLKTALTLTRNTYQQVFRAPPQSIKIAPRPGARSPVDAGLVVNDWLYIWKEAGEWVVLVHLPQEIMDQLPHCIASLQNQVAKGTSLDWALSIVMQHEGHLQSHFAFAKSLHNLKGRPHATTESRRGTQPGPQPAGGPSAN